jgi:hypothetical protein
MDDIQVILYIIFGIIYFIFRVLKNKQATKDQPQYDENKEDDLGEVHGEPQRRRQGTSLEDILRELSGEHYEKPEAQAPEQRKKVVEESRPEAQTLSATEEYEIRRAKEEAKRFRPKKEYEKYTSSNLEEEYKNRHQGRKYKTLDEQIDIEEFEIKTKAKVIKLEEVVKVKKPQSIYLSMLKSPQEAKNAIILSAIINRKYD